MSLHKIFDEIMKHSKYPPATDIDNGYLPEEEQNNEVDQAFLPEEEQNNESLEKNLEK